MLTKNSTILTHDIFWDPDGWISLFYGNPWTAVHIISNDFIWFWHTMSWPHHLGPSVRMAGSPQARWQATGHRQPGTGRRVGGVELVGWCCHQAKSFHSSSLATSQIYLFKKYIHIYVYIYLLFMTSNNQGKIKECKIKSSEGHEIKELKVIKR